MRLAEEKYEFETIGTAQTSSFSINATAKAYRILIDGLYSNKIEAAIRETAANGWDSHVEAGKLHRPIFVHCPNEVRPEFFVRDYGVSMDHQKVTTLYTTLFASDKEESDDLVGAFGLGSKSPFAYTDQFYITCFDGMVARHYTAAIGGDGAPQLILNGVETCGEPRGARVGFAVRPEDFAKFRRSIERVAYGFEPEQITSNIELNHLTDPVMRGDGWTRFTRGLRNLSSGWWVRQGCVLYPISGDEIILPGDNSTWVIDCPIGTIQPTTSREEIAYKPAVVAYIQGRIEALIAEVDVLCHAEVDDIPVAAEYFRMLARLAPSFLDQSGYVHAPTGLSKPEWLLPDLTGGWTGDEADENRWSYEEHHKINLLHSADRFTHMIRDGASLEGPNRLNELADNKYSEKGGFTYSERRKLARLWRGYLEFCWYGDTEDLDDPEYLIPQSEGEAKGLLVCDLSPDEVYAYIGVRPTLLTVPQMRAAARAMAPARAVKTAMVQGVGKVEESGQVITFTGKFPANACWIEGDFFRHRPEILAKIVHGFGFSLFTLTATARKTLAKEGITPPHFLEAFEAKVLAPIGMRYRDWTDAMEHGGVFYRSGWVMSLYSRLRAQTPDLWARMLKAPQALGYLARQTDRILDHVSVYPLLQGSKLKDLNAGGWSAPFVIKLIAERYAKMSGPYARGSLPEGRQFNKNFAALHEAKDESNRPGYALSKVLSAASSVPDEPQLRLLVEAALRVSRAIPVKIRKV